MDVGTADLLTKSKNIAAKVPPKLFPPLFPLSILTGGGRGEENDSVLLSGKRSEGIYPKRRRRKRRPKSFYCLAIAMAGGGNFHPGTINSCGETQNKKINLAQKTQKEIL